MRLKGPSGIGKSRVLDWLYVTAKARGATIGLARASGREDREGPARALDRLWATTAPPSFPPATTAASGAKAGADARPEGTAAAAVTPSRSPGSAPSSGPGGARAEPEPRGAQEKDPAPARMWRYLQGWRTPVGSPGRLLLVDDLEEAGEVTRWGLSSLERVAASTSTLLVTAIEEELPEAAPEAPEEPSASPPSASGDEEGSGGGEAGVERDLLELSLSPLPSSERGRLARQLLRLSADTQEPTLDRLLERAGGEPLTIVELSSYLDAEGWVERNGDGPSVRPPSPALAGEESVEDPPVSTALLLDRRILRHPASERELLGVASLVPDPVEAAPLAAAVGKDPVEVERVLELLDASGDLLRSEEEGGVSWRFPHAEHRQAARRSCPEEKVPEKTRALCDWWVEHHPRSPFVPGDLLELAREGPSDILLFRQAVERAMEERAWGLAERMLQGLVDLGLRHTPPDVDALQEATRLVHRLRIEGEGPSGLQVLERLSEVHVDPPLRWEVEAERSAIEVLSDPESALARYQGARNEMEQMGGLVTPRTRFTMDAVLLDLLLQSHQYEEGVPLADDLLGRMGSGDDLSLRLDLLDKKGWCLMGQRTRWREAHAVFLLGATLAMRNGRTAPEAILVSGQAFVRAQEGECEQAVELFRRSAALSQRAGDLSGLALQLADLAESLLLLNRPDEAEGLLSEGLDVAATLELEVPRIALFRVRGELEGLRGAWAEARRTFEELLRITGERSPSAPVTQHLLLYLRAVGESGRAREALDALLEREPPGAPRTEEEAESAVLRWRTLARLQELCGLKEAAVRSGREAEKVMLQRREELRPGDRRVLELHSPHGARAR